LVALHQALRIAIVERKGWQKEIKRAALNYQDDLRAWTTDGVRISVSPTSLGDDKWKRQPISTMDADKLPFL